MVSCKESRIYSKMQLGMRKVCRVRKLRDIVVKERRDRNREIEIEI